MYVRSFIYVNGITHFVLDILCHPSSTYHHSKAARPYIDISPKHCSKTAEQPDRKAANPWRQSG